MTVEIGWHCGPRSELRALFELAEDSQLQLDSYLDLGRVLVARRSSIAVAHLQLVARACQGEVEIKNMAVVAAERRAGIGRALVSAAKERCIADGSSVLVVATGAADVGNLRFYQRVGFRMLSIERDAFTPEAGYPDPIDVDGIPLRDRVWLSQELTSR